MTKAYSIQATRYSYSGEARTSITSGTLAELTEYFGYTLECGHSYERERGRKKVNTAPKSARALVTALNNAQENIARNGCASTSYSLVEQPA